MATLLGLIIVAGLVAAVYYYGGQMLAPEDKPHDDREDYDEDDGEVDDWEWD
jgi:hypothetical protein